MRKTESVPKNVAHRIHWDFEIQTDHLIPARGQDQVIINKTNLFNGELCLPRWPLNDIKRNRKEEKVLGACQRTKKDVEHESDSHFSCHWCTWNDPKNIGMEAGRNWNCWTSQNNPKYGIVNKGYNTEKSPGSLRKLSHTGSNERPSTRVRGKNTREII